jgi:hypothetical protein
MKNEPGTIRFILGLLMVFGAVGGLEAKPDAAIGTVLLIAVVGLGIMLSGTRAMERNKDRIFTRSRNPF